MSCLGSETTCHGQGREQILFLLLITAKKYAEDEHSIASYDDAGGTGGCGVCTMGSGIITNSLPEGSI